MFVGGVGGSFVDDLGGAVGEWSVDDVAVSGDPADVGGAPVDVVSGFVVEDVVVGVGGWVRYPPLVCRIPLGFPVVPEV